jgi:hypothetical protein
MQDIGVNELWPNRTLKIEDIPKADHWAKLNAQSMAVSFF